MSGSKLYDCHRGHPWVTALPVNGCETGISESGTAAGVGIPFSLRIGRRRRRNRRPFQTPAMETRGEPVTADPLAVRLKISAAPPRMRHWLPPACRAVAVSTRGRSLVDPQSRFRQPDRLGILFLVSRSFRRRSRTLGPRYAVARRCDSALPAGGAGTPGAPFLRDDFAVHWGETGGTPGVKE